MYNRQIHVKVEIYTLN